MHRLLNKYLFLLDVGGLLYILIELAWRGWSHWTMFILGGICFIYLGLINEVLPWSMPLWQQILIGAAGITVLEFCTGCIVNLWLGWGVWDYSGMPFNLGGRINLLYCFFWGIAAVAWFKKLYPRISGLIEKIPHLAGKIITWTLIIFMCCNIVVSCMALIRYDERGNDVKSDRARKTYMDEHYGDEKMQLIYPNAKMTD